MKGIYLLLGSNLGDSQATLKRASDLIERRIGKIVNSSSIYATEAWGIEDQPDFLNQVFEIESLLSPQSLLLKANAIEKALGRKRLIKWDSRIIDIDILYYGALIIDSDNLIIPHPENQNRNFVLVPMTEIAPDLLHPVLHLTQAQLLDRCEDKLSVKKCHKKSQPKR